jgi:hypothetical protein
MKRLAVVCMLVLALVGQPLPSDPSGSNGAGTGSVIDFVQEAWQSLFSPDHVRASENPAGSPPDGSDEPPPVAVPASELPPPPLPAAASPTDAAVVDQITMPQPTPGTAAGFVDGVSTEILAERTVTSRTFRNPDGTKTALVHAGPVHWKNAAGELVPIDASVVSGVPDTLEGVLPPLSGALTTASGPMNLAFLPANPIAPLVTAADQAWRIGFDLEGRSCPGSTFLDTFAEIGWVPSSGCPPEPARVS